MENKETNSVTFSLTTKAGFDILLTLRESEKKKLEEIVMLIEEADNILATAGFTAKKKFGKKEKKWTGEKCPKCKGRLYYIRTKTGKDMCKCENGRYDFATKKTVGCDFVLWGRNFADAKRKEKEYQARISEEYSREPEV